jgi:hypothetical protein
MTAEFAPALDVVAARGATVRLSSQGVRGSLDATLDARATGAFTFVPISTGVPGVPTLTIPPVPAFGEAFRLQTSATSFGAAAAFGDTIEASAGVRFAGVGTPQLPAFPLSLGFGGRVGGNFDLDTAFSAEGLAGFLTATHETGATVAAPFPLDGADLLTRLDLSLEGRWSLGLLDVALLNTFESGLTIAPFGEAFWRVGDCGGGVLRICVARGSTSLSGPASGLGLAAFSIAHPRVSAALGQIEVTGLTETPEPGDPVAAVPAPPAVALLASAIGLLLTFARRFAQGDRVV